MTARETRPKQERPAHHRAIRVALWSLLGLWVAALAALLWLALALLEGWQTTRLRDGIEWLAPSVLKREVRIGRLEGGLRDGLVVHDVRIAPLGEDADAFGEMRVLRIGVRLDERASLRRGAIVLADLTIVRPTVELSRVDERGWLVSGWGPLRDPARSGPPTVLPLPILLGTLVLSDAELSLTRDVRSGLERSSGRLDASAHGIRLADAMRLDWPVEASVRLQLEHAGWRGVDFGHGGLTARLDGPALRIERFELDGPVGRLQTTGAIAFTGPLDRPRARSGDLHGHAEGIDLAALARRGEPASSEDDWTALDGDVEVSLRDRATEGGEGFDLAIKALLSPSIVLGGRIERADLSGAYRTGVRRWWLHESTVELAAARVEASGTGVALNADRLELRADGVDLERLPVPWRRDTALSGRADIAVSLRGALGDPAGSLDLSADGLFVDGAGPSTLALEAEGLGDRQYRLDALEWRSTSKAGRFADAYLLAKRAASLSLADGALAIEDLALEWTGGSLAIDGGLRDGALLPSHVEIEALDLSLAARLLGLPDAPGGIVSGGLDVSGPVERPDVRATLDWSEPRYRGLHAEHVALQIDGDAGHRRVAARMTLDGREALRLSARLPRPIEAGDPRGWLGDARTRVEIDAQQLDLAWLSPLTSDRGLEPAGLLDGRLALAGSPEGPTANGELEVDFVRLERVPSEPGALPVAGPLTGGLRLVGRSARSEGLSYGVGVDEFSLDAELGWSGPRASDVDFSATVTGIGFRGRAVASIALRGDSLLPSVLTFDDFEVAEIARRARTAAPLLGTLTGEVVVRGPLAEPDFRSRLEWRDPQAASIRADRLVLEARSQADLVLLRGDLERGGRRVLETGGQLPLDRRAPIDSWLGRLGRWPTDPDTRLGVTADAFPLDWLAVLAPGLPLKTDGRVTGRIDLTGGDPAPEIDGSLAVDRGTFALATQSASVGPLTGTIHFEGQRARFDRLHLSASRGAAVLAGRFDWAGSGDQTVSLRADFDGYRFDQLGLLQANLDGSLLAEGALQALRIEGSLALDDIRIAFPSQEDPVLKEIRVRGLRRDRAAASILESEAEIAGIEEQSTVDVSLMLPRGSWVRGMGLDAEITGEIDVTKVAGGELRYLGRMQVEHGRYTLQGKRFDLDSGIAFFTGGESPIPDLDIQAHRRASRNVEVFAHVTGPADQPRLELTSDPPMDVAEIISYLYFGRSASVGDRESQGIGASAGAMVGSMLVDNVAPELRETLRIDEISVTSADDGAPAVEIETQVTPDVYLRLIQSFGASADEAVEVRWRFWKGLSVKSRVSRSGNSAVDLLWEFDFWGLENYGVGGLTPPPPPYQAGPAIDTNECRPPLICPSG